MQTITTIGLDIAKSVFQVHGVDGADQVIIRRQLKRRSVLAFFQKLSPCLVGIAARPAPRSERCERNQTMKRSSHSAHDLWICAKESSANGVLDKRKFLKKLLRLDLSCLRTKLCCRGMVFGNCDTRFCLLQCSRGILKLTIGLVDRFTPIPLCNLDSLFS